MGLAQHSLLLYRFSGSTQAVTRITCGVSVCCLTGLRNQIQKFQLPLMPVSVWFHHCCNKGEDKEDSRPPCRPGSNWC